MNIFQKKIIYFKKKIIFTLPFKLQVDATPNTCAIHGLLLRN